MPPMLHPIAGWLNDVRRKGALDEFVAGALTTADVVERLPGIGTVQGVHRLGATGKLLF